MPADTDFFVILKSVDSTNNYAMGKVHSGNASDGNAWFALKQTAGKGRRGKAWQTQSEQNILLSIVMDTRFLQVYEQFKISIVASLSCYDFFNDYAKNCVKIKWPNDLYWNDSKAGGILIENVISGNIWQWSVIGIGININQIQFPKEISNAVSLKQITGKTYDVIKTAEQLYKCFLKRWDQIKKKGFDKMLTEYNNVLYKKGEKIRLRKKNIIFETTLKSVSKFGQLQTADTIERNFDFDEVEWVL